MYKVIIRGLVVLGLSVFLLSCEKQEVRHKQSVEEKLVYSFRSASVETVEKIRNIVIAAKDKNYSMALNELAVLSATNRLSNAQKASVTTIMRQLRYDMEEEEFSSQISPAAK